MGGPNRIRHMHQVVRGEQQYPGRDHRAKHGDEPAGRGAHGEGPALSALAAVFGVPPLAQLGRQGGAPGSPAVARRRGHAECREQEQPGKQQAAQLGGLGQRSGDAARAEQGERGFGPVGPQRLPPPGVSLVLGVRRKAAFRANRPSTDAFATTREVDCQMNNAPIACRQVAPVPRRSSATARASPSTKSTGMVVSRNGVSLQNSLAVAGRQVGSAGEEEGEEGKPEQVAVPLDRAGEIGPPLGGGQVVMLGRAAGNQGPPVHPQDLDAAEAPPVPLALQRFEGQWHDAVTQGLIQVQP